MIGYQHSRVPNNLLNLFQAPGGEAIAPFPDYVVTNGAYSARALTAGGFDSDRVKIGCAIQIGTQSKPSSDIAQATPTTPRPVVLVACSEEIEEAEELVEMAVNLFASDQGVEIVLKCHPNMPFSRLAKYVEGELPPHVSLSNDPIASLFPKSSLLVYTGSMVSVQALAMGLPVIHLRPQFDFDLDPLEGHHGSHLVATGIDDLRSKVSWLLEHRSGYIQEHRDAWSKIVDDLYAPVTDEAIKAFVSQPDPRRNSETNI